MENENDILTNEEQAAEAQNEIRLERIILEARESKDWEKLLELGEITPDEYDERMGVENRLEISGTENVAGETKQIS